MSIDHSVGLVSVSGEHSVVETWVINAESAQTLRRLLGPPDATQIIPLEVAHRIVADSAMVVEP